MAKYRFTYDTDTDQVTVGVIGNIVTDSEGEAALLRPRTPATKLSPTVGPAIVQVLEDMADLVGSQMEAPAEPGDPESGVTEVVFTDEGFDGTVEVQVGAYQDVGIEIEGFGDYNDAFAAISSDQAIADVAVSAAFVRITGVAEGTATVTVISSGDETKTAEIAVTVVAAT